MDMITKKILSKRNLPFTEVISVLPHESNSIIYIFDSLGNMITVNMKTLSNMQNQMFEATSSEIIFAALSSSEKNVFLLKDQGNIIIKNL